MEAAGAAPAARPTALVLKHFAPRPPGRARAMAVLDSKPTASHRQPRQARRAAVLAAEESRARQWVSSDFNHELQMMQHLQQPDCGQYSLHVSRLVFYHRASTGAAVPYSGFSCATLGLMPFVDETSMMEKSFLYQHLSAAEAGVFVKDLLSGLGYLHDCNMIHW
jgi:serine/threonine protein kinase